MAAFLPRTVVVLGLVSFLNDAASEMITPLLPLFLTATLGAGPAIVGLVEGVAEATASLLKLVSGRLADRGWNAKGLVVGGYGVSNAARPLIGLALGWGWVLVLRFLDRVGKGIRTAPRDALIAESSDPSILGRAFGFHRALDNAGAMVGPLIAFVLLETGMAMSDVFFSAAIPGAVLFLLLVFGLEAPRARPAVPSVRLDWQGLDGRLRGLVIATGGLALAAAPEAFLVLWASQGGFAVNWIPLLWAAASGIKAIVAGPAGVLSDHFGRLPVVTTGWVLRIGLLVVIAAVPTGQFAIGGLFLAYAGALAMTEGAERALLGDLAPVEHRGTVYGLYHLLGSLMALPGAVLFGAVWQWAGMASAFMLSAALTLLSSLLLLALAKQRPG